MQVVYKNEDKGNNGRKTSTVDINIYIEKTSKCVGKNVLEDLKAEVLEFEIGEEFLEEIKKNSEKIKEGSRVEGA